MDMLSSRSYLELAQEAEISIGTLSRELTHLRPRRGAQPEMPDEVTDKQSGPGRPVRKRGRPKLEAKDATAIEERRLQIRRAQRTYRLKKENTIQTLRSRVNVLEQTLENVSDLLGGAHRDAINQLNDDPTLQPSVDYLARTRELILAEINKARSTSEHDDDLQLQNNSPSTDKPTFGYEVSHTYPQKQDSNSSSSYPQYTRARSPSPLINRILPTTTIYTYSHQESNLARRLHRFSLEHTYRWLTDPRTDPALLSRVFGLVPCIHDMAGIRRNFRRTLQSEIGSGLEFIKMPFYTLGGAGKHFPCVDSDGNPVYPENSRRPGKILRRMVRILQRGGIQDWDEDWSGDREPVMEGGVDGLAQMSEEERIRSLDLDGEWFDCRDVQGYLEHRGFVLDGSGLRLGVPESLVGALYGFSPDRSTVSSLYASPDGTPPVTKMESESSASYTLDVECFFDLLLANLRILGRAPGFRLWDVDAALRSAISRRPFG